MAGGGLAGAAQAPAPARGERPARPQAPTGANQVWAYDFVFDRCANGQQLKCLTITDEWTREGLAIEVDRRIRSTRVIEVLARLVSERGAPLYLRSDNGPEFVSQALLAWIVAQGIDTALIEPGKPWQNANGESFNGKFRDECLSLEWFRSRAEAKVVIERWRPTTTKNRSSATVFGRSRLHECPTYIALLRPAWQPIVYMLPVRPDEALL